MWADVLGDSPLPKEEGDQKQFFHKLGESCLTHSAPDIPGDLSVAALKLDDLCQHSLKILANHPSLVNASPLVSG